ncbi:MAG: sigma-70 family RNA polymerase sigma factor [Chloroflexi bacterium]|nr:sigma-70 family RNA polymerase sigma factor [Chloroflexota bacterium]
MLWRAIRSLRPCHLLAQLQDLGDSAASEDVLQEVFLKLWRQPEAYDPDRGSLSSWLMSVAHHRAIDFLRRQKTRSEQQFPETWPDTGALADETELNLSEAAGQKETAVAIKRALTQIPVAQRQAIEMAFFQGKTHAEISAELGEPLGTAKTRIRLGMRKLRLLLEADGILGDRYDLR